MFKDKVENLYSTEVRKAAFLHLYAAFHEHDCSTVDKNGHMNDAPAQLIDRLKHSLSDPTAPTHIL